MNFSIRCATSSRNALTDCCRIERRPASVLRSTLYPGNHGLDRRSHQASGPQAQGLHSVPNASFRPGHRGTRPHAATRQRHVTRGGAGSSRTVERIAPEVTLLKPTRAEFAKLFTNAYRYIGFAITNQFYLIAKSQPRLQLDPESDEARLSARCLYPDAGFAAGPCLSRTRCSSWPSPETSSHSAMPPSCERRLPLHIIGELRRSPRYQQEDDWASGNGNSRPRVTIRALRSATSSRRRWPATAREDADNRSPGDHRSGFAAAEGRDREERSP